MRVAIGRARLWDKVVFRRSRSKWSQNKEIKECPAGGSFTSGSCFFFLPRWLVVVVVVVVWLECWWQLLLWAWGKSNGESKKRMDVDRSPVGMLVPVKNLSLISPMDG